MTGPEHYRTAERLLRAVDVYRASEDNYSAQMAIAEAQVHATLALAAATAELDHYGGGEDGGTGGTIAQSHAWQKVLAGGESR